MIIYKFLAVTRLATALAIVVAVTASCAPVATPQTLPISGSETTVYIVRHAEKAPVVGGNSDVDLSSIGYARADSLAAQLRDAGIDVVITTQLRRTRLTAKPVADMRGVVPIVVPAISPVAAHAESVAVAVGRHPGSRILIVGHSNTVGPIIGALGGGRIEDLCDGEYANLFILTLSSSRGAKMLIERYGTKDPVWDGGCVPVRARH